MSTGRALASILLVATAAAASDPGRSLEHRLEAALRSYDAGAAVEVLSSLRGEPGSPPLLRVRAGLAVAELLRLEFESTAVGDRELRRILGARIDAAAEEALQALDELPESSERERLRADLLATLIRSDYRAKRHQPALEAAIARALELDPANPRALATAAKPLIFAPPEKGRDLVEAVATLDRALALDPGLESALLLKALALEMQGKADESQAVLRLALAANPDCRPARDRLAASR